MNLITIFFPSRENILKNVTTINNLGTVKRKRLKFLWIQNYQNIDIIIYNKKLEITYADESLNEVLRIIRKLARNQNNLGIKVYNEKERINLIRQFVEKDNVIFL